MARDLTVAAWLPNRRNRKLAGGRAVAWRSQRWPGGACEVARKMVIAPVAWCTCALRQKAPAMTEAVLDIQRWGNGLGVRLPAAVARAARLTAHQRVRITVEDGRVIITPQGGKALSLAERLAQYDPAVHGGEVMASLALGREVR